MQGLKALPGTASTGDRRGTGPSGTLRAVVLPDDSQRTGLKGQTQEQEFGSRHRNVVFSPVFIRKDASKFPEDAGP
ncbi:MAG: hypothetical protein ACLFQH_09585, partial [Halothiobacillaceae bacterium]